jgi:hypothetical protein
LPALQTISTRQGVIAADPPSRMIVSPHKTEMIKNV